jgi:hypothetical protein
MDAMDRRALARCQKAIKPYARADEHVLDFDVGKDGLEGMRLDLVATDRALYVLPKRKPWIRRIPYEEIATDLEWTERPGLRDWYLILNPTPLHDGSPEPLFVTVKEPRALVDLVRSRVAAEVLFEKHISYGSDIGATYRYRPWKEGNGPIWEVAPDPGFDPATDPGWDSRWRATIEDLKDELPQS